jgi:superfamily II DNA or RNA helicase
MNGLRVLKRATGLIIGKDTNNIETVVDSIRTWIKPVLSELQQFNSKWNPRTKTKEQIHVADWWFESKPNGVVCVHRAFESKLLNIAGFKEATKVMEPVMGEVIDVKMQDFFSYREGQDVFVNHLAKHQSPIYTRILPATMGAGKTVSALAAICKIGRKALIIIPPSLTSEWMDSIAKFTTAPKDTYAYVSGGDAIGELYNIVRDGGQVPYDITVMSINSLQSFIKLFKNAQDNFSIMEFFDRSGWGVRIVDEAHKYQHFHMLCSSLMNFDANLFLTATLMKEYAFDAMVENAIYPKADRCKVPKPTNHIELISYQYEWDCWMPDCNGPMGYMHSKYEKYIIQHPRSLKSYLGMCSDMINRDFVKKWSKGDRALIFFALVDMVDAFIDMITKQYPHLRVIKYGAGDAKDKLVEADIIISTVKKAGTGTDIPSLRYVLQTIPISAKGENMQNIGRLRNLHHLSTTFAYLWTNAVPKHFTYHTKRQDELTPLVKSRSKIKFPKALTGRQSKSKYK